MRAQGAAGGPAWHWDSLPDVNDLETSILIVYFLLHVISGIQEKISLFLYQGANEKAIDIVLQMRCLPLLGGGDETSNSCKKKEGKTLY